MPTRFSKMTKPQKIMTSIFFAASILIITAIASYYNGIQTALAFLAIIPISVGVITFYKKFYQPRMKKQAIRRGWSEDEKEIVRSRQSGKCNKCGKHPPRWEYHHRDGNRSNNSLNNCEGLCPNCHSVKTHDK